MAEGTCPICKHAAEISSLLPKRDVVRIGCRWCGHFVLFSLDRRIFESMEDRSLMPFLSAYIRQNSGPDTPIELKDDWESHALRHKATPVSRKLERTLRLVAEQSSFPGDKVDFPGFDIALVDATHPGELFFLLNQLVSGSFLTCIDEKYIVTASGWERLEAQSGAGIPGRCFVAMSFDHSLDDAWEKGIYPALKIDCGLDPIRIDKVQHNEKICDKLIAEIRLSQFLVADFTLHRAGVYFEAGFALGLGRPVIWTCRKDELAKTHFDSRQYNHIDWTTPEELRERLRDRVLATIPKKN